MCMSHLIFFFFIIITPAARSIAAEAEFHYTNCSHPFVCGPASTENNINTTYPFWGYGRASFCGSEGFELGCQESQDDEYAFLDFNQRYRVLRIDRINQVMTVARNDIRNKPCLLYTPISNTSMDNNTQFHYPPSVKNITMFYCSSPDSSLARLTNKISCPLEASPQRIALFVKDDDLNSTYSEYPDINNCNIRIRIPVLQSSLDDLARGWVNWEGVLNRGFELAYRVDQSCSGCESSAGVCGTNSSSPYNFVCYCSDKPYSSSCPGPSTTASPIPPNSAPGGSKIAPRIYIGIGSVVAAIFCVAIVLYLCKRLGPIFLKGQTSDITIDNFVKQHGSLSPKRFRYSQLKKMTDSFREKLGQGGFGAVYKGKLSGGTLVAVKLLNASKGNGEDFINEVASISRTSHVNIVNLIGFCFEGHKRALIYEFMSNGSLDKYIHDGNALGSGMELGWEKLYHIALGIARGLEYLHQGCNTRILHFDIKPQNILLDDGFCPKISDFGLSKLCLNRESVVSMLTARGTIGYIAPEVFSRNFGEVSHKSDVYSYGMMLIEMVQGRKSTNITADRSSEAYFHDQVYRLVEQRNDKGLYSQLMDADKETARKMVLVGVWCIQTDPKQRPSMWRVIEMLEGSAEACQIPPKPYLFSPPRNSSSISVSLY